MSDKRRGIDRRTLLRGAVAGGAMLALPPLAAMVDRRGRFIGTARAATGAGAQRLIVFHMPNGVFLPDFIPTGIDRAWTPSALLTSLAAVRSDINIVSGLSNERLRSDAHESPNDAFLTGSWDRASGATTGPSIDTVLASSIGQSSHIPALRISLNSGGINRPMWFGDDARAIEPVSSPTKLYQQITGQITGQIAPAAGNGGGEAFASGFRRSVLSQVKGDLDRLRARCGVGDRRVLDEYTDAIATMERRLSELAPVSCQPPPATLGARLANLPDQPPIYQGIWPNTPNSQNLEERLDVLVDLALLALRCDLTRVVVISLGSSNSRQTYPFLGQGNTDDHYYSHLQQQPQDRAKQLEWNAVTQWKLGRLASLIEKLKAPLASGGSLLDSTLVVGASELGNGAGHSADMLPVIVAGNVGPMASASGRDRHLAVPCSPDAVVFRPPGVPGATTTVKDHNSQICAAAQSYTPLANLWLTALAALGVSRPTFGDGTGTLSGLWL